MDTVKNRENVFEINWGNRHEIDLFRAPDNAETMKWIYLINYNSAIKSKEPNRSGAGNADFGWAELGRSSTPPIEKSDSSLLPKWNSGDESLSPSELYKSSKKFAGWTPPSTVLNSVSALNELEQHNSCVRQLEWIEKEIEIHSKYEAAIDMVYL